LKKVNPDSPHLAKIQEQLKTSSPVVSAWSFVSSRSVETGKGTFQDLLKDGSSGPKMVWIPADESIGCRRNQTRGYLSLC